MRKYLNILLFIFLFNSLFSQEESRKFIIDSDTDRPIPFAVILNKDIQKGWVADQNGSFSFNSSTIELNHSLEFTARGYETRTIPYLLLQDTSLFYLSPRRISAYELEKKTNRFNAAKLGKRKSILRSKNKVKSTAEYSQLAVKLVNCDSIEGIIENINLYIDEGSLNPISITVYSIHPTTGLPENRLNKEPIFIKSEAGGVWLNIDVTFDEIEIPLNGLFIALDYAFNPIFNTTDKTLTVGKFKRLKGETYVYAKDNWVTENKPLAIYLDVLIKE